jgi:hypothetical protein
VAFIPRGSTRGDVSHYITRANETGTAFAKQYKDVSIAYRSLALAPSAQAAQTARLRVSANRLTLLRQELQAIPAPAAARRLRTRLIAFYRSQEQVAHELVGITVYFPQLIKAEAPLQPAAARLRKSLAKAKSPEAQAAVLGSYASAVQAAAGRIGAIHAPALLAAAQRAEQHRVVTLTQSIRSVRRALLANDKAKLKTAIAKLGVTGNASAIATRAAIVSYNRHVAKIRKLGAQVELERRRLDRKL